MVVVAAILEVALAYMTMVTQDPSWRDTLTWSSAAGMFLCIIQRSLGGEKSFTAVVFVVLLCFKFTRTRSQIQQLNFFVITFCWSTWTTKSLNNIQKSTFDQFSLHCCAEFSTRRYYARLFWWLLVDTEGKASKRYVIIANLHVLDCKLLMIFNFSSQQTCEKP